MGTVYFAEQLRPVRRQVALKLIKPGMDSRNVLARFESERQALALMEHPHIARVLDAGTTADGRPFFVMELVKGIPITEYCDAHRLDLPARLALFRQVCSAVQHAHQKGIIHRDLKPSNILVESHDDKPVPKVIDFGLAKATSGLRLTEQSLFTAFGSVAGTPLYMAPEQASFNALDIDTRADIYALGVILYELLAGSTPIRRETMQRAALDEMLRVIREDEPPTPSSRISTSEALPTPGRQPAGRAGAAVAAGPGRAGLDRDEGAGQGAGAAVRLGHRPGRRPRAVPQPRAGLGRPADGGLPAEEVRAAATACRWRRRRWCCWRWCWAWSARPWACSRPGGRRDRVRRRWRGRKPAATRPAARSPTTARQAEKRLAQVTKMNDILGSIFKDLDPRNVAEGRQAAVGGPGRAAGPGDGRDRGGGDRRPARRGPDADDPGRFAVRPGLPGSGDRAVHQGPRHLRRRARPRPPRHAREHEQPRQQLLPTPARTTGR